MIQYPKTQRVLLSGKFETYKQYRLIKELFQISIVSNGESHLLRGSAKLRVRSRRAE